MSNEPKSTSAKDQFAKNVSQSKPSDPKDIEEKQLWSGGYSGKAMFGSWVVAALVTAGMLVAKFMIPALNTSQSAWYWILIFCALIWGGLLLVFAYQKLANGYVLTNQRLKHRDGILVQSTNRIELIDVDDVMYKQGPIQILLNVGNITVKSSDDSHPVLVLKGIANVRKIADLIDDARRDERRRRGVFVESV
jgi:membrane protein YdbS with pleckstrin-like domain